MLVPTTAYPEIRQCAVVMKKSEHQAEAHAFLDWLLSPAVQENLTQDGAGCGAVVPVALCVERGVIDCRCMDFAGALADVAAGVRTTAMLLVVALPLAWWIASGHGAGRALVQAVVALPLVLPPTVLGFYLLVALGPLTAPGRLIDAGCWGIRWRFSLRDCWWGRCCTACRLRCSRWWRGFGRWIAALLRRRRPGGAPCEVFRVGRAAAGASFPADELRC